MEIDHLLRCPLTRQPVHRVSIQEARDHISGGNRLSSRVGHSDHPAPVGETDFVLLRGDNRAAYPITSGMPVLLGPEVLSSADDARTFDLKNSHYAESYSESYFYNQSALADADTIRTSRSVANINSESVQHLTQILKLNQSERLRFPLPITQWMSGRMDLGSESDCFEFLAPISGRKVLQIGGKGISAVLFLLAHAESATLLTPMIGEAVFASELAVAFGVSERFAAVVAIAEEMPFVDGAFDAAFSGGCVHHMTTALAFPESARVLKGGGRFAAVEPWRAPFYSVGTRVFGKREANAFCRPLTKDRVAPMYTSFSDARYVQHGALTRYPMLALEKMGARIPLNTAWRVGRCDDTFCSVIPGLRKFGSGIALLATK